MEVTQSLSWCRPIAMYLDEIFVYIYFISISFGTFPLWLSKRRPKFDFQPSKLLKAYSYSCIVMTVVHGIITPWYLTSSPSSVLVVLPASVNATDFASFVLNQTDSQLIYMKMVNPLILTFMSLGSYWVSACWLHQNFPSFWEAVLKLDVQLSHFYRPKSATGFKVMLIVCSLVTFLILLFYGVSLYEESWSALLWGGVLIFNNMASFSSELQFLLFVYYLQQQFKCINSFLFRFESHTKFKPAIDRKVILVRENPNLLKLEIAHECHKRLCDIMDRLNQLYNLQVFCAISGCFVKILFNFYFSLFSSWSSEKEVRDALRTTNWTIFYLMRFVVTTIMSSRTAEEVSNTKTALSNINSRSFSPEVRDELNLFLHHASNRQMSFTGCGLFTLNTTLITSAFASVTTYVVILVQFRPQIS